MIINKNDCNNTKIQWNSEFLTYRVFVSSVPPRRRLQDRVRYARGLLRKTAVRESGEGARGGWDSLQSTMQI